MTRSERGRRHAARAGVAILIAGFVAWGQASGMETVHSQPSQPVTLATGQFSGADSAHRGKGRALLVRLPDGRRFLRFEEFRVTNGPDLYVYLSGHNSPRSSVQLHQGGAFEVGVLKGNVGNQNYELPATLDLSTFKSVAIYCKRFSVMFASAELITRP